MIDMQVWTPGDDPMLALLPPEPPWGFQRLPREEQAWRGRLFLLAYVHSNNVAFSWAMAMDPNPAVQQANKDLVASYPDDWYPGALEVLHELQREGT